MTSFKKPKVYFGAGGFTGVGTIGKSPIVGAKKPMVYGGGVSAAKVLTGGGISRGGVIGLTPSPKVVSGLMREFPRQKLVNAAEFERAAKGFGDKIPSEVKPLPEKRREEFSKAMAEKEMEFVEADAKAEKPGEAEVRKNMMEMARKPKAVEPPKVVSAVVMEFPRQKLVNAAEFERAAKGFGYKIPSELESIVPLKPIEEVMAEKAAAVEEAAIEPQTEPPTMAVLPELPAAVEEAPMPQVEVTIAELPKYTGFSKGEWGTGSVTTPELPLGGNGGKKKRRRRRRH